MPGPGSGRSPCCPRPNSAARPGSRWCRPVRGGTACCSRAVPTAPPGGSLPAAPSARGRRSLLALLAPPRPAYSPLILPLGLHSNALSTFGGGPGTVGLHGWPNPSVFGHAVSNGCVRVPAAALHLLAGIPLGTLVLITR